MMPTLNEHDAAEVRRIHEQIEAIRRDDFAGTAEPGCGLRLSRLMCELRAIRERQYGEAK